jgi:charged multivesicular body protein 1
MSDDLFDNIFEFKMMAKQMKKEAERAKKNQEKSTNKIKSALQKNNTALAKQCAEEALRYKKDVTRYTNLSYKIGVITSKLQQAYKNNQLTQSMKNVVSQMKNMTSVNDVTKMMETMDNFEKMFDNIDVTSNMMDQALDNINAGTVNDQEVNNLIDMLQEQNAMGVDSNMVNAENQPIQQQQQQKVNNQYNQISDNYFP